MNAVPGGFGATSVRSAVAEAPRAKKRVRVPKPAVVDFETFAAEDRPLGPPVPVGVSIKFPGKKARYYAWGHVSGNDSTWGEAREALLVAWAWPDGVVFHNQKFDLTVAYEHMDLPELPPERAHDTMFLGFLDDPNRRELGLKPMASRLLGWSPGERDAVADWLVQNQPVPGVKISTSSSSQAKHPFMAYLPYVPAGVVGLYANGDVDRTEALFEELWRSVTSDRGMGAAYDRERRLVPVLMENERHGIRVDFPRLSADAVTYRAELARVETWLRRKIGADDDLNLGSEPQLIAALFSSGLGDAATWPTTEKSTPEKPKYSTAEEAFRGHCTDRSVAGVWAYRLKLATSLNTFLENWLVTATLSGGYIYTDWHQIRGERGGGARTGRLSSSPNFQNLVKKPDPLFLHEIDPADEDAPRLRKMLPKCPIRGLLPLPLVRSYIVPYEKDHVLIDRDYSQQEPRILAHFEGGLMKRQYLENPWLDFHDNAKENLVRVMHRPYKRKAVKNINLGIIYGQGLGSLAEKNGSTVQETKEIRDGILRIYPGLDELKKRMKALAAMKQPLITWGSRRCLCEEPALVKGKFRTHEYKMINTLVQGSAADCTKEAMIRFRVAVLEEASRRAAKSGRTAAEEYLRMGWRLYMNVHDELLVSVPRKDRDVAMEILRRCMESIEFDVPMLSEGEWSPVSWAALEAYDAKGKRVAA